MTDSRDRPRRPAEGASGRYGEAMAKDGTFLVTHADDETAVLRDVRDSQIHTLAHNPDLTSRDIIQGTIAPTELGLTWRLEREDDRREISLGSSEESPTAKARELAEEQPQGEVVTLDRAGEGVVHVLTVPPGRTQQAVSDILDDEATLERAARLAVSRVEVRAADGVVTVRYLP